MDHEEAADPIAAGPASRCPPGVRAFRPGDRVTCAAARHQLTGLIRAGPPGSAPRPPTGARGDATARPACPDRCRTARAHGKWAKDETTWQAGTAQAARQAAKGD